MTITAYSYTNQGGRVHNEDSLRLGHGNGREVFVLADGLGGHGRGEVASALAAEAVCRACLSAGEAGETALREALEAAEAAGKGEDAVGKIARFLCQEGATGNEQAFLERLRDQYDSN